MMMWCMMFCVTYTHAAPFQNGSFENNSALWDNNIAGVVDNLNASEQDLTGWTIEILAGGHLEWRTDNPGGLSGGGTYSIELAGNPSQTRVSQIFDTVAGKNYQITYWLVPYNNAASTAQSRQIKITVKNTNGSGTLIGNRTDDPVYNSTWQKFTFVFTAQSSLTYLSFENTVAASFGTFLDLITVDMQSNYETATNTYVYDPFQQNLKPIPGQDMGLAYSVKNTGGAATAGTFDMKINLPPELSYKLHSFTFNDGQLAGTGAFDPTDDYEPVDATGLTCCTGAELTFSSDGTNYNYTPSADFYDDFGNGYDDNVRSIRIKPSGTSNSGAINPVGFRVYYFAKIK
jgi:hypothetical protein